MQYSKRYLRGNESSNRVPFADYFSLSLSLSLSLCLSLFASLSISKAIMFLLVFLVFCSTSVLVVVENAFRIRRVPRKVEIIVLDDTHHRPPMIGNRFRVSCASLFTARLCSFRLVEVCSRRIVAFRVEQTGRTNRLVLVQAANRPYLNTLYTTTRLEGLHLITRRKMFINYFDSMH